MEEKLKKLQENLDKIFEELKTELLSIRTGRVTPAIVENIKVSTYGGSTQLKLLELATITNQNSQTLLIVPFDPSTLSDIENSLKKADIGATPQTQAQKIYLKFPPLTEEKRKKFTRIVSEIVEEYKRKIRGLRDNIRKQVKAAYEDSQITEDLKFSYFKRIDEITKEVLEKIEKLKEKKIDEIQSL